MWGFIVVRYLRMSLYSLTQSRYAALFRAHRFAYAVPLTQTHLLRFAFAVSLTQFRVCGFTYSVYYVIVYIHMWGFVVVRYFRLSLYI